MTERFTRGAKAFRLRGRARGALKALLNMVEPFNATTKLLSSRNCKNVGTSALGLAGREFFRVPDNDRCTDLASFTFEYSFCCEI